MNELRVSVATFNQVIFPHPENGTMMLVLERKATVLMDGSVSVCAQPLGGGVKLRSTNALKEIVGEINFDSDRSRQEQDFRILIDPAVWEAVKQYCLLHLQELEDPELESAPDRELVEEFEETIGMALMPRQYTVRPLGLVIEDNPVGTENWYARGIPTVRVYRTYKVKIDEWDLRQKLVDTSQQVSDDILAKRALENEKGRANSVLALPLDRVREAFFALPPNQRFKKIKVDSHQLDESVLVVLEDIEVSQYQRL